MAAGYVECFSNIWETAVVEWRVRGPTKNFVQEFFNQLRQYGDISAEDILITLVLGVLFTFVRYVCTELLFKPIANYYEFIPKDRKKFPESAWKVMFYGSAFSYSAYILFGGRYQIFQNPIQSWTGWQPSMPVPSDIYTIYVLEAGFYFHSIYATIFMDKWRADSVVMIGHHILANALILFSFATRYYNIGIMVLFLHDISDIFLEGTKICLCFKSRPGGPHHMSGAMVNLGFLSFAISWFFCRLYLYPHKILYTTGFICRLYFYPHKVLHTTGHSGRSIKENEDLPFYFFFNGMLWLLFAMNIWWFHFIIMLVWRVLKGSSREVEDTREYSSTDSVEEQDEISPKVGDQDEIKEKESLLVNGIVNGPVHHIKTSQNGAKPSKGVVMNGDVKKGEEKDVDEKDGQQEKEYLRRRKHNMRGN